MEKNRGMKEGFSQIEKSENKTPSELDFYFCVYVFENMENNIFQTECMLNMDR